MSYLTLFLIVGAVGMAVMPFVQMLGMWKSMLLSAPAGFPAIAPSISAWVLTCIAAVLGALYPLMTVLDPLWTARPGSSPILVVVLICGGSLIIGVAEWICARRLRHAGYAHMGWRQGISWFLFLGFRQPVPRSVAEQLPGFREDDVMRVIELTYLAGQVRAEKRSRA